MPPRIAPKRVLTNTRAVISLKSIGKGPKTERRIWKSSSKIKKQKQKKQRVKKWLETPADWARFEAWAKINAKPRKIPKIEPIVRPSRPIHRLLRRIYQLSQPRERQDESLHYRREFWKISKAALKAPLSNRILYLSFPRIAIMDYGRDLPTKIPRAALNYEATDRIIDISQPRDFASEECKEAKIQLERAPKKKRYASLNQKRTDCFEGLTKDEWDELFTPYGIKRKALSYKATRWMSELSLPAYKVLKDRRDRNAKEWKKLLLERLPTRGKEALMEKEQKEREKGSKRKRKEKGDAETKEEQKGVKKSTREMAKHAWRYAPRPDKDDPFKIKEASLKHKASSRTNKLASPLMRKDQVTRREPFRVKKSALAATGSPRIDNLAKPTNPLDHVEAAPPRKKDKYGAPIFKKPVYGKALPKTKPYKMRECKPTKEKKDEKTQAKKDRKRKQLIHPIAFQPTIDPCICPILAKRQMEERKKAEMLRKRMGESQATGMSKTE